MAIRPDRPRLSKSMIFQRILISAVRILSRGCRRGEILQCRFTHVCACVNNTRKEKEEERKERKKERKERKARKKDRKRGEEEEKEEEEAE